VHYRGFRMIMRQKKQNGVIANRENRGHGGHPQLQGGLVMERA
jgi:hypothetical protein